MNPAQNKYNQSKYKICKAFINLLETKELHEITISEICTLANVSRNTFYNHYANTSNITKDIVLMFNKSFYTYILYFESNHSIKISSLSINDLSNIIISDFLPFYLQRLYKYKDQLKVIIKRNYIFDFDSTFKIIYNTFYEPYFEYFQIPKKYRMKLFAFTVPNSFIIIKEWILSDCTEAIPVVIKDLMFCINIQAKLADTFLSANFQSSNSSSQ